MPGHKNDTGQNPVPRRQHTGRQAYSSGCCVHHAGKKHDTGCCQCNYSIDIELQKQHKVEQGPLVWSSYTVQKTAWKYIYTTQSFVLWPPPMHRASTSCLDCTLVIGILWRYLVKLPKQPFWIWGWTHKAQESTKADHRCVGCRRAYKICQDG